MANVACISEDEERFTSWKDVFRNMGPIYLVFERVFYVLGALSLKTLLFRFARHAYGLAEPKLYAVRDDVLLLIYFILVGICLPALIMAITFDPQPFYVWVGVYIVLNVLQHQTNVMIFDRFRANRLPKPRVWIHSKNIEQFFERWIFPLAPISPERMQRYIRTGGSERRLFLAIMDYWLLFIGYSLIYWSNTSMEFSDGSHNIFKLFDFDGALYFSVVAGTTLGFGDITPHNEVARFVTLTETLTSFLFALVIIAYTISLIPRAPTLQK